MTSTKAMRRPSTLRTILVAPLCGLLLASGSSLSAEPVKGSVDVYLRPYVATNNFSGSVLVTKGGVVLFQRSYGLADRRGMPNRRNTRFHVASLSILFTSTAVLRLIDEGRLSFDTHVSDIVPGVPNGEKITIHELLEQTSGLADANDLPDYDQLMSVHQTPQSLIDRIKLEPPFSEPGVRSDREEHSGQNLLALIIERKTGLTFAQAMKREVFDPYRMRDSGIDDDGPIGGPLAQGQQLFGPYGLKRAPAMHWSAKPGNGSAYTTVDDEWTWLTNLVHGNQLSEGSKREMLDATSQGYGWDKKYESKRLDQTVYVSGGRCCGFSSVLIYLPRDDMTVIALTNIENAANPLVVQGFVAMLLGKPYDAFDYHRVSVKVAGRPSGDFVFGPDFYRPSATLSLVSDSQGTVLNWPGGPAAPLLPIGKDKFMDRFYWNPVSVVHGGDGNPAEVEYGKFRGVLKATPAKN
jgi:CubicO group peptidase (beta-lactamase class C family)